MVLRKRKTRWNVAALSVPFAMTSATQGARRANRFNQSEVVQEAYLGLPLRRSIRCRADAQASKAPLRKNSMAW